MVLSAEDISYVFKRKICNVVYDVYGYLSCRYNLFRSSCAFYIVCRNAVAVCNVCNYFSAVASGGSAPDIIPESNVLASSTVISLPLLRTVL